MKHLLLSSILMLGNASALAESLLITDARLIEQGFPTDANYDILVSGGVINRIGENLSEVAADAVIDAAGRPVTGAFFAGITALGLNEIGMVSDTVDSRLADLYTGLIHPEFDVRQAYNPHSSAIPVTRVEGYGYTVLAASPGERPLSGHGSLVRLDGGFNSFEGKRVMYADVSGASGDKLGGSRAASWMLLNATFAELTIADKDLKLITAQGKSALADAKKNGIFIFSAHRASDILRVLEFITERGLKAMISGGQEAWMVREELAAAEVPVIINALDNLPTSFDTLGARLDNAALLHDAGVTVLFTSGETHNARKLRQVAGNAVAHGLPHKTAMAAITSLPAALFGGFDRSVRKGSRADLVIWSGDPLDVNSAADTVIIGGKVDSMQSRQTYLLQRYLPEEPGQGRAYINPQ
jgi:imidazolonepropionase-like amidohydrolase